MEQMANADGGGADQAQNNIQPGQQDNNDQLGQKCANMSNTVEVANDIPTTEKIAYVQGEKTIVCWNCLSVLMVKEEWSVVQCTNCEKFNRIPGVENDLSSQIRLNDNMNHFDLFIPYVFAIITCPFCQTENKIRKDAEHVVCYKCHNSFSLQKEGKFASSTDKGGIPKNKSLRFSDLHFPDPMFYPGYYPQNYECHQCHHKEGEADKMLEKLLLISKLQNKMNRMNRPPVVITPDRYKPLRQLVRDVDEIGERRMKNYGTPGLHGTKKQYDYQSRSDLERIKDEVYRDIYNPVKRRGDEYLYSNDGTNYLNMGYPKPPPYDNSIRYNMNPMPYINNNFDNNYLPINSSKGNAIYRTMFTIPGENSKKGENMRAKKNYENI